MASLFPSDRHKWGTRLFFISLIIPLFLIVLAIRFQGFNTYVTQSAESGFYSETLLLMVNLVGFVFIILVFIIQNTTQSYSSNLSKEVLKDNYLIAIPALFSLFTIYILSSIYFSLSDIFIFGSYLLSLSSLLLLLSLTLFVSHYLDISNIISVFVSRNIGDINRSNLFQYREIEAEDQLKKLKEDTSFFRNVGLEAIENNDYAVVDTCISSLESYGTTYLREVETPVEKEFIQHLNDQYTFILNDLGEEYSHQKNLETLSESIGKLARETYENSKSDKQTLLWLKSLKEIFELTQDGLDRTEAYGKSIREINRTILLYLNDDDPLTSTNYLTLSGPLEEIITKSVENSGNSTAVQICLQAYQWQIVTVLNNLSTESQNYSDYDIDTLFNTVYSIFKLSHDSGEVYDDLLIASYFRLNSLFSVIRYYGIYGLSGNEAAALSGITAQPPPEVSLKERSDDTFSNVRGERSFLTTFLMLVSTHNEITKLFTDTNYSDSFSGYTELFFITSRDLRGKITETDSVLNVEKSIVENYCDAIESHIDENDGNRPDSQIIDSFVDYILILYYFAREDRNDKQVYIHVVQFVKLYSEVKSAHGKDSVRWLYRHLKLFGALIHDDPSLRRSRDLINELLAREFYEPDSGLSRSITPMADMGYPRMDGINGISLSPKQTWKPEQQRINYITSIHMEKKCRRYHRYLLRESKWV